MGGLNAQIVASGKTEVLVTFDDFDLLIAFFYFCSFVLSGGIIYHDYLYCLIVER